MVVEQFNLTRVVYDEIVAHARDGKPKEVCGVLRGRGLRAFEAVRGRNVARDPIHDYELDPQTLLRQFEFEEAGDEMVAIYHSHPASPAYPSGSDAWNAHYPDAIYLICSLQDDKTPVLRAFRLTPLDLDLDLARLRSELKFDETRPGRFAYHQSSGAPIPPLLQPLASHVPFYVVFETAGKNSALRGVSVIECPIRIESNG